MKLVHFSIERFRSLIEKSSVDIGNNTVIIGPNNEGKSNMLRALIISLKFLEDIASGKIVSSTRVGKELIYTIKRNVPPQFPNQQKDPEDIYSWDRDFPVSLRDTKGNKQDCFSEFVLHFQLENEEYKEFKKRTNTSFKNKTIPIKLAIGSENARLSVFSSGQIPKNLSNEKIKDIADFITKKISICYIEAVRTAETAINNIDRLLDFKLKEIYESDSFKQAEGALNQLLIPALESVSNEVLMRLKTFIPSVQCLTLNVIQRNQRYHNSDVLIDDGNRTPISQKGSGVQSLMALSLAQIISLKNSSRAENLVLAIEEPESHLHPDAIHEIKKVLSDIAKHNQLIITTHSPLLANANDIKSNIIVAKNIAHQASSLKEIRETLGVLASDSLLFADNNIFVEGLSDKFILKAVLSSLSERISLSLKLGTLKIFSCQGSSKISAFVSLTKNYFCKCYIVLDNDSAGVEEKNKLITSDPNLSRNITSFSVPEMDESEIEDFINPKKYIDNLIEFFGFSTKKAWLRVLNGTYKTWSDRLNDFTTKNGHPLNNTEMIQAKTIVANAVVEKGLSALVPSRKSVFETLAQNIEKMLDE